MGLLCLLMRSKKKVEGFTRLKQCCRIKYNIALRCYQINCCIGTLKFKALNLILVLKFRWILKFPFRILQQDTIYLNFLKRKQCSIKWFKASLLVPHALEKWFSSVYYSEFHVLMSLRAYFITCFLYVINHQHFIYRSHKILIQGSLIHVWKTSTYTFSHMALSPRTLPPREKTSKVWSS